MSILLDAVTRNKQQQTSPLPDAVFTPRASYSSPRKAEFPVAKWSLLAVAIALGVGGAWGVANWQPLSSMALLQDNDANNSSTDVNKSGTDGDKAGDVNKSATDAANAIARNVLITGSDPAVSQTQIDRNPSTTATPAPEVSLETPHTVDGTAGFRLAGKVALPREQVLYEQPLSPQGYVNSNMNYVNSSMGYANSNMNYVSSDQSYVNSSISREQVMAANPNTKTDPSYDDYLATSAALAETIRQQSSTENRFYPRTSEPDPIILGANANAQGFATLEALRQQVNAAAVDVGLNTSQSRQDDELVATFQAALKEVEYTNATKTPVTQPKLDPIPKTENDDIPRYGQLAAGLQLQVPEFNIVAHVYSTNASQRWLNVDGAELQEGDLIAGKLKIIAIRPRDVVLDIQGTQFRVPAI